MFLKNIGPVELIVLLLVLVIVFGVGRVSELGGALGRSIRDFRREIRRTDDDTDEEPDTQEEKGTPAEEA
jgi:sec-independent protein translocase protein TatA